MKNRKCGAGKIKLSHLFLFFVFGVLISCSPSDSNISNPLTVGEDIKKPTNIITEKSTTTLALTQQITPTVIEENKSTQVSNNDFIASLETSGIIFDVEKNESIPPVNVIKQLKYSAGFGGTGYNICTSQESWSERTLFWTVGGPSEIDNIFPKNEVLPLEWNQYIEIILCGLEDKEKISYTLFSPEVKVFTEKEIETVGERLFEYISFPIGSETGIYTISFQGSSWEITRQIKLSSPETPRLYGIGTSNEDKRIFLYHFQPNEIVTLLVYVEAEEQYESQVKELYSWKQFKVDENGQQIINLDFNYSGFWSLIAIGEKSGEVHAFPGSPIEYDNQNVNIPKIDLELFLPTADESKNMQNLWDMVGFQDVRTPTTITYKASVAPDEKISWSFFWCTTDYDSLKINMENFTMEFYIQSEKLDDDYIRSRNTEYRSDWICQPFKAFIHGWEKGKEYTLEMRYTLSQDLSDGKNIYKAGTYHHIINVTVQD